MNRDEIIQLCEAEVLETAAARFGTQKNALYKFPEYEGAANLVYEYKKNGTPFDPADHLHTGKDPSPDSG